MSDFGIPRQDGAARDYFNMFAGTVADNLGLYMLQPADSAAISLAAANYSTAYTLATTPATRTDVTVQQKDQMRSACEALIRLYSIQIKYNQGIPDSAKTALRISPRTRSARVATCRRRSRRSR